MRTIEAIADPVATGVETNDMMKTLVYGGPGQRTWQSKPKPITRRWGCRGPDHNVDKLRRTNIHILKGDVPDGYAGPNSWTRRCRRHRGRRSARVDVSSRRLCCCSQAMRGCVCRARRCRSRRPSRHRWARRAASSSTHLYSRARPRPCGMGPSRDGSVESRARARLGGRPAWSMPPCAASSGSALVTCASSCADDATSLDGRLTVVRLPRDSRFDVDGVHGSLDA